MRPQKVSITDTGNNTGVLPATPGRRMQTSWLRLSPPPILYLFICARREGGLWSWEKGREWRELVGREGSRRSCRVEQIGITFRWVLEAWKVMLCCFNNLGRSPINGNAALPPDGIRDSEHLLQPQPKKCITFIPFARKNNRQTDSSEPTFHFHQTERQGSL